MKDYKTSGTFPSYTTSNSVKSEASWASASSLKPRISSQHLCSPAFYLISQSYHPKRIIYPLCSFRIFVIISTWSQWAWFISWSFAASFDAIKQCRSPHHPHYQSLIPILPSNPLHHQHHIHFASCNSISSIAIEYSDSILINNAAYSFSHCHHPFRSSNITRSPIEWFISINNSQFIHIFTESACYDWFIIYTWSKWMHWCVRKTYT